MKDNRRSCMASLPKKDDVFSCISLLFYSPPDGDSAGATIVISDRQIPNGKVIFMSIKGLGTDSDQTGFVIGIRFDSKDPRSNLDERCF
eukprot:g11070.t1